MRPVLYIALLFLTACGGGSWLQHPVLTESEGGGTPAETDWLQEGGDAQRSYRSSTIARLPAPDSPPEDVWSFTLDGAAGRAGSLRAGDIAFFTSSTAVVEAVDLRSGENIGQFSCEWVIHSTPAILNGQLYIATIGAESPLHCFSLNDGSLRWRRTIEPVEAALCAHEESIFAAGLRGGVYRFDDADSVEVWRADVDAAVRAAPAATDTVLIVATTAGDLIGLHTLNGSRLWRLPLHGAVLAGPVIGSGRVVAADRHGTVLCADAYTGSVQWTMEADAGVFYSPLIVENRVYVPAASGVLFVYALEDGALLATLDAGELPAATPMLFGETLLQLTRKGEVLGVDIRQGTVTSLHRLPRRSETPPLMVPGGVLLIDEEGEAVVIPLPVSTADAREEHNERIDGAHR